VKRILVGCFIALLINFFVPLKSPEAKPVTFAYQTPTLSSTLPILIGMEFGFFAAEGLEVKPIFIIGGPTAIAALIGGDVDYTLAAAVPTVRAIVQGAPLAIVGGIQPTIDYTLIGAKGIATVNDLKGKVVGVTGAGGIAEFASVEGLAKKGLVRDRDYKILYGVGNSPARAQALEAGRIQASPFSFSEKLELERKGFPVLFDIGQTLSGFPFVVIASSRRKAETDPEGTTALLRGMKRSMDLIITDKEKVIAAAVKKGSFGDPGTIRKVVEHFAGLYSISITKGEIEAAIAAARLEAEAKKLGGAEKFFIGTFAAKALGQAR
jgi:ABC-type nitrate/sulfonate/bicarbonate transport system substrate-binding protein